MPASCARSAPCWPAWRSRFAPSPTSLPFRSRTKPVDLRRERAAEGALLRGGHGPAGGRRGFRPRDRRARPRAWHLLRTVRRNRGAHLPREVRADRPDARRARCAREHGAIRVRARARPSRRGTLRGARRSRGSHHVAAARLGRLRLRPDLLLPAVRLHPRRAARRAEVGGQPPGEGVQEAQGVPGGQGSRRRARARGSRARARGWGSGT